MSPPALLEDIKIVDFSRVLAGPFATQILGDFGAQVVKVEPPGGDDSRAFGTVADSTRPVFAAYNRNKRSIQLDLKSDAGLGVARQLVKRSDVLVHNYRVGVIEALGLGYEDLQPINPGLVYCAISAFGAKGPRASTPGVDLIVQAYSGLVSFTGELGREPIRVPISIADLTTGIYAALGIVSALVARNRDGVGQKVETSLFESLLTLLGVNLTQSMLTGVPPVPRGNQSGLGQPNQIFRVNDGRVAISVVNDRMFARFSRGIGAPELAEDPRFALFTNRHQHRGELAEEISVIVASMSVAECVDALQAEQVICAPICGLDDVALDPQVAAMGSIVKVTFEGRDIPVVANPLHYSTSQTGFLGDPPDLGEHSSEILAELGYSSDAITSLRETGAVS